MAIKRPARPAAEAPTWVLRAAAPVLEAEAAVPVAEPVAEPVALVPVAEPVWVAPEAAEDATPDPAGAAATVWLVGK